jgi:hypothetical protein
MSTSKLLSIAEAFEKIASNVLKIAYNPEKVKVPDEVRENIKRIGDSWQIGPKTHTVEKIQEAIQEAGYAGLNSKLKIDKRILWMASQHSRFNTPGLFLDWLEEHQTPLREETTPIFFSTEKKEKVEEYDVYPKPSKELITKETLDIPLADITGHSCNFIFGKDLILAISLPSNSDNDNLNELDKYNILIRFDRGPVGLATHVRRTNDFYDRLVNDIKYISFITQTSVPAGIEYIFSINVYQDDLISLMNYLLNIFGSYTPPA